MGRLLSWHPGKAAGPDGIYPQLHKVCTAQPADQLQWLLNISLQMGRVPVQWKTSCLVPVPKVGQLADMNDFHPVVLHPPSPHYEDHGAFGSTSYEAKGLSCTGSIVVCTPRAHWDGIAPQDLLLP